MAPQSITPGPVHEGSAVIKAHRDESDFAAARGVYHDDVRISLVHTLESDDVKARSQDPHRLHFILNHPHRFCGRYGSHTGRLWENFDGDLFLGLPMLGLEQGAAKFSKKSLSTGRLWQLHSVVLPA